MSIVVDDEQEQFKFIVDLAKQRGQANDQYIVNYRKLSEALREGDIIDPLPAPRPMAVQDKIDVRLKIGNTPAKSNKKRNRHAVVIISKEAIKEMKPAKTSTENIKDEARHLIKPTDPRVTNQHSIAYTIIQRNNLKLVKRLHKLKSEFEKLNNASNYLYSNEEQWETKLLTPLFTDEKVKNTLEN